MSGNLNFYSSNRNHTPINVATYSKKKFEPKVMRWISISLKGLSTPVLTFGHSMAVKSSTLYIHYTILEPCTGTLPSRKISEWRLCRLSRQSQLSLCQSNVNLPGQARVNYVAKDLNPTEIPLCRHIEVLFGVLATHVYAKNWIAFKDTIALKRRIRRYITRIPQETVQSTARAVRKILLRAYRLGILKVCHRFIFV